MANNLTDKIILSDIFSTEEIAQLKNDYVEPYPSLFPLDRPIRPRRHIGDYVTFSFPDQTQTYSIIIKKGKSKVTGNCTCDEYIRNLKCRHIAQIVLSIVSELKEEQNEKQLKKQEEKNKKESNKLLKKSLKKPSNKDNSDQIGAPLTDSNIIKKGPYIVKSANNISLPYLYTVIPTMRRFNLKNRSFTKNKETENGFDLLYNHKKDYQILTFYVNTDDDLEVNCSCGNLNSSELCIHALESLYQITDRHRDYSFLKYCQLISEKNELLQKFGLTVKDPESKLFTFTVTPWGNLTIADYPEEIMSVDSINNIEFTKETISWENIQNNFISLDYEIGFYFEIVTKKPTNNPIRIDAFKIETLKNNTPKYIKTSINRKDDLYLLSNLTKKEFDVLMDFSFLKYKPLFAPSSYLSSYSYFCSNYYEPIQTEYLSYFFEKLRLHWQELSEISNLKLCVNSIFSKVNLTDLKLFNSEVQPKFIVEYTENMINLFVEFRDLDNNILLGINDNKQIFEGQLILSGGMLYLINTAEVAQLLKFMPSGKLSFSSQFEGAVISKILMPLMDTYGLELPSKVGYNIREDKMQPAVYLREFQDKYLIIEPRFSYGSFTFDKSENDNVVTEDEGKVIIKRDKTEENNFVDYLQSTNPAFGTQNFQPYFTLPFKDVMKDSWFLNFSKDLLSKNIKIAGFNDLKKFRYNTSTPTWDMKISSGIDWFDVKIKAKWGDQEINVKDIRKAILNGQDFVVLGDGSFGVLPEEWLNKYTNLLKFGIQESDNIQINKRQFNIIDMLFDEIDDNEVMKEINEKKQKLLKIEDIETQPIPSSINATLRPYQETGYQWMQVLDEISWGGCLADDMGLGKTLQTITFLAFVKNKYPGATSLIVCPTSLIYNWENELTKFAPDLKYHIFYGTDRIFTKEHYRDCDIIISTYGIVRNDIELLRSYTWEYVVLDESQAIKNPDAISTKAVQLLNTRNRLILSGTPMQNNTYDIYAQFNFLNPGMLGSRDFFKQEFSNPIDKNGDADAGHLLRNLIKPFLLRRTKSEVAADLPEKTETVLWCEMDKTQKEVYDEYRDFYRHSLMSKIESEGIGKSGIYILEGLLRLRQICDDPRLLKDDNIQVSKGVKIKELIREVEENMGNHKMLVFSQFTEMLALIRQEFDSSRISYCYLDGSTQAKERKHQVEKFQTDDSIKVFLISLKAGGVGLNLTEADYVYIVDPWWNPAVEQQAIDRTHRIGQKNKIFAYKMICKDSVEEKIMKLQQKKLALTKEIVQDDSAFFKKLTREDISYLFS